MGKIHCEATFIFYHETSGDSDTFGQIPGHFYDQDVMTLGHFIDRSGLFLSNSKNIYSFFLFCNIFKQI